MANTRAQPGGIRLFNEGERLQYSDLNNLGLIADRSALHLLAEVIWDSISHAPASGFFGSSCLVSVSAGLTMGIARGLGFYYDPAASDKFDTHLKPIAIPLATTTTLDAHDADPRIDIICVASATADDESVSDAIRDPSTGTVTTQTIDTRRAWYYTLQVVKGTPAASPAIPSTPAGYIKIAECRVPATAGAVGVVDTRPRLYLSQQLLRGVPEGWFQDFIPGTDELLIEANGSAMEVYIDVGNDGDAVINGSAYWYKAQRLTITTAPVAPNKRKDRVVATNDGTVVVVPGTPGIFPVPPATPSGAIVLAEVYVNSGVVTIDPGDVTDYRIRTPIKADDVGSSQILDEAITNEKLADAIKPIRPAISVEPTMATCTIVAEDLDGVPVTGNRDFFVELRSDAMDRNDAIVHFQGAISKGTFITVGATGDPTDAIIRSDADGEIVFQIHVPGAISGDQFVVKAVEIGSRPAAPSYLLWTYTP